MGIHICLIVKHALQCLNYTRRGAKYLHIYLSVVLKLQLYSQLISA